MKSSRRTWSEPGLFSLRPARPSDGRRLLAWRNHPRARRASFHQQVISPAAHGRWLRLVLADPARHLFVFERNGRPLGMVRFDGRDQQTAEVSVLLEARSQGRGLGRRLLRAAMQLAGSALGLQTLVARVKNGNRPSLELFLGQGFVIAAADSECLELVLGLGGR